MENEYLCDVVVKTEQFDLYLVTWIYLTLYFYSMDLKEDLELQGEDVSSVLENKCDLLLDILRIFVDIITDFDNFTNDDIKKVMYKIVYYQKKV